MGGLWWALVWLSAAGGAEGGSLLVVLPHPGRSHLEVWRPLLEELARRGHRLTLLSPFSVGPLPGLTHLPVEDPGPGGPPPWSSLAGLGPLRDLATISEVGLATCRRMFASEAVARLLRERPSFDLALVEVFTVDCGLALADSLGVPFIGLSSSSVFPTTDARFAATPNPAYVPNMFLPYGPRMTFLQRARNTFTAFAMHLYRRLWVDAEAERVCRGAVGAEGRSLAELAPKTRLLLANRHYSLSGPRPLPPPIIEVGGIHIRPHAPLPKDIERFINNSDDGIIVFSMGSIMAGTSMPEELRETLMKVFSQLDQGVIWKYEDDHLTDLPTNVFISKWLPQRNILARKEVRLFVSHGGMLSLMEAVHSGVPVLGLPVFGDQHANLATLSQAGAAIVLDHETLDEDILLASINTLLNDSSYTERARELSMAFRSRPMSPLATGVYWTEYALTWGSKEGWPLASPGSELTWIQASLLDVGSLALVLFVAFVAAVYLAAVRITDLLHTLIFLRAPKQKAS